MPIGLCGAIMARAPTIVPQALNSHMLATAVTRGVGARRRVRARLVSSPIHTARTSLSSRAPWLAASWPPHGGHLRFRYVWRVHAPIVQLQVHNRHSVTAATAACTATHWKRGVTAPHGQCARRRWRVPGRCGHHRRRGGSGRRRRRRCGGLLLHGQEGRGEKHGQRLSLVCVDLSTSQPFASRQGGIKIDRSVRDRTKNKIWLASSVARPPDPGLLRWYEV